ncbi:MAG: thioredoxin family protein [Methanobacteriaceae archaeon]
MKSSNTRLAIILIIIAVLIVGIISLISIGVVDEVLSGDNLQSPISTSHNNLSVTNGIKWQNNLDSAIEEAKSSNKKVLVYFEANWCSYCKQMNDETFTDSNVQKTINNNYIPVAIDGDENPDLCSKYNVFSYPTIIILDPNGNKVDEIPGFRSASELLSII